MQAGVILVLTGPKRFSGHVRDGGTPGSTLNNTGPRVQPCMTILELFGRLGSGWEREWSRGTSLVMAAESLNRIRAGVNSLQEV